MRLIRVAFSAPAARTLNSFTATTAPAVASTASANAAHGEGRANTTTRSRPSCRPRSMIGGGVDIAESDGDGSSVRADPDRGRNGLRGRAAVSAIYVVRSADFVTGPYDVVARVEAAHRCAREARRQENRGGRGHDLDPDLPRGAALPAARSGRTADLTPDPKRLSYGSAGCGANRSFRAPQGTSLNGRKHFRATIARTHRQLQPSPADPAVLSGRRIRTRHLTVGCVYMSELESNRSSVRT
jgi:hypothetical protein